MILFAGGQRRGGRHRQITRGGETLVGLLGHAPGDHLVEGRRDAGAFGARTGDRLHEMGGDDHADAVAAVGLRPGEAFVQHARQRIDVGAVGHDAAGEPFGRHVGVGAHRRAQFGQLLVTGGVGDAEVHQIGEVVAIEQDVLGLDVAVHDATLVRGVEGGGDLAHDGHRPRGHHRPEVLQDLAKIGAVDHAHVDEEHAVDLAVVVDRYDVRFLQPPGRMRLALQPLAEHRVVRRALRQQLQRDDAILDGVLGLVDLAHPALADQAQQAVGPELGALPRLRLAHLPSPRPTANFGTLPYVSASTLMRCQERMRGNSLTAAAACRPRRRTRGRRCGPGPRRRASPYRGFACRPRRRRWPNAGR